MAYRRSSDVRLTRPGHPSEEQRVIDRLCLTVTVERSVPTLAAEPLVCVNEAQMSRGTGPLGKGHGGVGLWAAL